MSKTNAQTNTAPVQTTETQVTETPATKILTLDEYKEQMPADKRNNVSAQIRYLASLPEFQKSDGTADRGKIAKTTGKIYQHVRNVLITPVKRS